MQKEFILVGVQNLKIKDMNKFGIKILDNRDHLKNNLDIAIDYELKGKSFIKDNYYMYLDGGMIVISDFTPVGKVDMLWTSEEVAAFSKEYYVSRFIDDNEDISDNEIGIFNYSKLDKLQRFALLICRDKFVWDNYEKYWKLDKQQIIETVMNKISKNFPKDNKNN
jgi:hypothetical protein